jgi:hypothetical protein
MARAAIAADARVPGHHCHGDRFHDRLDRVGDHRAATDGTAALEYHVPTGVIARLFPLEHRSFSSATTICLDALDKVVETEVFVD